jgi:hypothetical protein
MITEMERVPIIMPMETYIPVVGLMGKWPVKVFLFGLMETDTR